MSTRQFLATMPLMHAISRPAQIDLPAPADVVYRALWAAAPTHWQAIRDCFNAGLRGPYLMPPAEWQPATLH